MKILFKYIFFIITLNYIIYPALAVKNKSENLILKVCTTANYKPVIYKNVNGDFAGVAPDILNGFAAISNIKIQYIAIEFSGIIPALLTKKCDLIATGMSATVERKKIIDFSLGMYRSKSYIIWSKNNKKIINPTSINYFNNKLLIIGIEPGSIYDTYIKGNGIIKNTNINYFNSTPDISSALIANKIDFTFHGSQFLNSLDASNPNKFNFMPLDLTNDDIAFGIRKDEINLKHKLNMYIEEINKNGLHAKILEKNNVRFIDGFN